MDTLYFKNKVTEEIVEYDCFMGLFYVQGKKFTDGTMVPISPLTISSDPNWEEYTPPEPVEKNDLDSIRERFFNWLKL